MNDKDFYENDRDSIRYEGRRVHHEEGFFERNCDEAWEQICETFSHPGRLLGRVLLIALLCGVVAGGSYLLKIRAPQLPNKGDAQKNPNQTQVDEIDYGDGVRPRADGERKSKDFYTVLVLGRDTGGGGNTDTMLLASYDVTNQKATVMSIPRDTMVNVPWDVKRINSVYNYYGGGEKGIKALYKEISQLVGFEPDYQVIVEWDAVGAIVEAMGGVYYDVPRNMNYDDPYQDLHIHQTKGYRKLSGSDVMQVLRYRHDTDIHYGYPDGDLGRIKTQQSLLKAMIEQLLQLKNVTKIGEFARAVKNNVTSDLTFEEMLWFGSQAVMGGLKVEDVNFVTMPNTALYVYSRAYPRWPQNYVFPKAQELLNIVNNELSPFAEKFTMSDLDIMSLNSDGSLSSSTGHVEDSKAAVAPPVVVDRYTGKIVGGNGGSSGTETSTGTGNETTDGSETTDPGTTDPGNSGTVDPGTTDPGNSGTVDPGTTDPGNSGTTDPGTGEGGNTGDTGSSDTVVDEMPEWLRP
ncbi:MAG TPA: transcriptional regulator [Oscillibacter sp.]|nr:transcriptional regulator [Oscillibacter sp.]